MAGQPYPDDGTNFTSGGGKRDPRNGLNALDPRDAASDEGLQNRNSFGGHVGWAQNNVDRYQGMGAAGANRSAYQTNLGQSDETRGMQYGSLALLDARARGTAPSAAELSGRAAMQRALANRVALAGGARGGPMQQAAALHRAGGEMAGEQAQMTQGIQAGRANEMAVASGQLATAAQGVRAEDLNAADLQQKAELAQRQLNQQDQQYYEGLGYNVNAAQLAANQNAQREADAREGGNISGTSQASDFSFGKGVQLVGMAAGATTGGVGSALAAAKGGHIGGEHPYLVGERGPELVVPDKPGFVFTTAQTAAIHGAPPTEQQIAARPELAKLAPHRALGGPFGSPMTEADPFAGYSAGELGMGGAGGLVSGTIAHENAIVNQAWKHPTAVSYTREGGGPMQGQGFVTPYTGMTGQTSNSALARQSTPQAQPPMRFAMPREEGGPIHAEEKGFAAGFRAAVAEHVNAMRAAAAQAISPEPAPIVVATAPPRAAVTAPRQFERYVAPDAPSTAPAGSGPVTGTVKMVPWGPEGVLLPDYKTAAPDYGHRACGGPMYARPRADGGPVDNFMTPDQRDAAGDPYERPPQIGAMGAPRGYAEGREGQSGYMFGGAPDTTHGYEQQGSGPQYAPGTEDWAKYGAPAVNDKDPNWKKGGATTPAGAGEQGGNWISRLLLGINGGMQPARGGYVR